MQGLAKRSLFAVVTILLTLTIVASALGGNTPLTFAPSKANLSEQPMTFLKNMGQWPDSILFRANANGSVMWFTRDGVYQQFIKHIRPQDQQRADMQELSDRENEADAAQTMLIKTSFVAANPAVHIETNDPLEQTTNFFFGNDRSKWRTNIPSYNSITYKNLYPGIDLQYYTNGTHIEYDFLVAPHADLSQIILQYDNAVSLTQSANGDLVATTKWGEVTELAPIAYHETKNNSNKVAAFFELLPDNSFRIMTKNNYDRNRSLILDPTIVYSTYLGGSSFDYGYDIKVDDAGSAYVAGITYSANFPLVNPAQDSMVTADVFVTKFSTTGNSLEYSTYLGGGFTEYQSSIALDDDGNAYVAGWTNSSDFPLSNQYQGYQADIDIFVAKISPTGDNLTYSTYIGGTAGDKARCIAIDADGNALIAGYTTSPNYPLEAPIQDTFNGGILTKLSSSGNQVLYSTYFKGEIFSMFVSESGNIYTTGRTVSGSFPTVNAMQTTGCIYGDADAFVSVFSPDGSTLLYSTYYGGASYSQTGYAIGCDASGNIYIAGSDDGSIPLINAYQTVKYGKVIFIAKFVPDGSSLVFSTWFGGNDDDFVNDMVIDAAGDIYLTGYTESTNFPTTNAHQLNLNHFDGFVTKMSSDGQNLLYSTYLGGNAEDRCYGIAIDGDGSAYVTGFTFSNDFALQNAYQSTTNGSAQAFAVKFSSTPGCCIQRGDVTHTGGLNVLDLNSLVAYFFAGGPSPICNEEADVNGNTSINVLDMNYLVAYFFSGGPAPSSCP